MIHSHTGQRIYATEMSASPKLITPRATRSTGEVDGVSGRRAQRLNRPSSTPGMHAEAAVRYTPTVPTLLLLVAVLTVVAASLLAPSRWFGRVERWAFWRRESVRGRVRDRRGLVYLYAGLLAGVGAVLVVWPLPSLLTRHPRVVDAAARHTAITNTRTGLVATL